jgi:diketogulonate reductase-like aldo/keto reductase
MDLDRRRFLAGAAAVAAPLTSAVAAAGGRIPAIGMGSWLTFDVGGDVAAEAVRIEVLRAFFAGGGRLIDSSPMYGSSQAVIGRALAALGRTEDCFAADKVWTPGGEDGPAQIERSRRRWGVARFDLLAVHNLVDWPRHLATLFAMKAEGRLGHVGVTTYAGLRHDEVERILRTEPIDFVQLTYNVVDREAEARLLPLAREKGVGVIANRPFREGALTRRAAGRPAPDFAAEIGAASWPQLLLKFIIAHPAVACAIPATRRVDHMQENMAALAGPHPDDDLRRRIAAAFAAL